VQLYVHTYMITCIYMPAYLYNCIDFMIVICSTFVIADFGFGGTGGVTQTGVGGLGGLTGGLTGGQPSVDATAAAIAQQNQQQLLQLTSSPYGDSPLFRNLRQVMQFCAYDAFYRAVGACTDDSVCLDS